MKIGQGQKAISAVSEYSGFSIGEAGGSVREIKELFSCIVKFPPQQVFKWIWRELVNLRKKLFGLSTEI